MSISQTAALIIKEFVADESKHHILNPPVELVANDTLTITRIDTKTKEGFERLVSDTGKPRTYVISKIIEDYFKTKKDEPKDVQDDNVDAEITETINTLIKATGRSKAWIIWRIVEEHFKEENNHS